MGRRDRAVTLMRVAAHDGYVLTYDTDDVEDLRIETPNDIHEVGVTENGYPLRELGQAHLVLRIDFKDGKRAVWIDEDDDEFAAKVLALALEIQLGIPVEVTGWPGKSADIP